jgi:hypothetical protein
MLKAGVISTGGVLVVEGVDEVDLFGQEAKVADKDIIPRILRVCR